MTLAAVGRIAVRSFCAWRILLEDFFIKLMACTEQAAAERFREWLTAPILERLNTMENQIQTLTDAINGVASDIDQISTEIGAIGSEVTTVVNELEALQTSSGTDLSGVISTLSALKAKADGLVTSAGSVSTALQAATIPAAPPVSQ